MEGRRRYDRSVTRTGVRTFAPPRDIAFPQKTTIADIRPSSVAVIRVGVSLYG